MRRDYLSVLFAYSRAHSNTLPPLTVLRAAIFPSSAFAPACEQINQRLPERTARALMVNLLDLADRTNLVSQLARELQSSL